MINFDYQSIGNQIRWEQILIEIILSMVDIFN